MKRTKTTATQQKKAARQGASRAGDAAHSAFPWRRLGSATITAMLVLGVVWGSWRLLPLLEQPPVKVVIIGDFQHLDANRLQHRLQRRIDSGLLTVDLAEIRRQVAAEPWVAQVMVRRNWPNQLQIEVLERLPLVRWNEDALMTDQAVIFRPAAAAADYPLPQLVGAKAYRQEILDRYRQLQDELDHQGLVIQRLVREPRGAWWLLLSGGQVIQLGREQIGKKIARFAGLYQAVLSEQLDRIVKIDLRYPHGAAVQWHTPARAGGHSMVAPSDMGGVSQITLRSAKNSSKVRAEKAV